MKWDWRLVAGHALHCAAYMTNSVANFFESVHLLIESDHDHRMDQKDFEMSISAAIESLPGGDDTSWGGTHEDDSQGGSK